MRYLPKLLIIILLVSQLSACSFTAIGQRKVLALESEALAPYKDDIRGGWSSSEGYFFETEQSIYHIELDDGQLTEWAFGIVGFFFLLPIVYYPTGWSHNSLCKGEKKFNFGIREITKQPDILFQRFSIEHFSFYDHETQKYFKPTNLIVADEIRSNVDIYHLPSDKKYLGTDLFDNRQIYKNHIEFSIDDMSCATVTPNDKLMIQKPPYIDVIFTFFEHKRFEKFYLPMAFPVYLDANGNRVDKSYSSEEVKHKIEPLPDVKNLEK